MRKFLLPVSLCAALLSLPASFAAAQHYHSDHHHHDAAGHRVDDAGHHIDNHGHHTGVHGVYDHYVVPSYYEQPTYTPSYVVPHTANYPQLNSFVAPGNVLPRPAGATFRGEPIQIVCPSGVGGGVNYALNNYKYSIQPGQTQTISADRDWIIAFGRGENFGTAKYSLTPGVYHFAVTQKGWELQKQPAANAVAGQTAPPAPPAPTNSVPSMNAIPATVASASSAAPVAADGTAVNSVNAPPTPAR